MGCIYFERVKNDFVSKWIVTQNIFPFLSKALLSKINNCYHHHHHHVVTLARISLTISRHFSLSFIASGKSSKLHPVSSHSYCMCVCSSWSSSFCSAICGGPCEYITYDLVPVSPASDVKKGIIKSLWVDLLCLTFLGLGKPALFYWELCLLVSGS